ncbi:unnamed protein product [Ascophyllum nodosum]
MKPLRAACADRLQRELHQLDRATPLKVVTVEHYTCLLPCSLEGSDWRTPHGPSTLQLVEAPISGRSAIITPREATVITLSVLDPCKTSKCKITRADY